jgi:hypothetical protein
LVATHGRLFTPTNSPQIAEELFGHCWGSCPRKFVGMLEEALDHAYPAIDGVVVEVAA